MHRGQTPCVSWHCHRVAFHVVVCIRLERKGDLGIRRGHWRSQEGRRSGGAAENVSRTISSGRAGSNGCVEGDAKVCCRFTRFYGFTFSCFVLAVGRPGK